MNKEELLMKVYDEVIELRDKLGKTNLTEEQKLIIEKLIADEEYILKQENTNLKQALNEIRECCEDNAIY